MPSRQATETANHFHGGPRRDSLFAWQKLRHLEFTK